MEKDNPAERLVAILVAAQACNKSIKGIDAWRAILRCSEDAPLYVVSSRYGKAAALVQEIIETCERHFPQQAIDHETWSVPISRAFTEAQFAQSIQEFNRFVGPHVLAHLRALSSLFDIYSKVDTLPEEQLDKFRECISTLLNEVLASDLSKDEKDYLARALHLILTALNEYRISGSLPVMRAIETVYGHAFYSNEHRRVLSEHPIGKKVAEGLNTVASALTVATLGYDMILAAPVIIQQLKDLTGS